MKNKFIGREKEQAILREAFQSGEAEMVALIGRRRVGKTALVKQVYAEHIDFEVAGVQKAPLSELLQNFALRLNETFYQGQSVLKPSNWLEAFHQLGVALDHQKKPGRMVVFLDELPWFDSHKSGFLRGLSYFWNSWAVNRDIVVVICGSAASWMIQQVVYDKGGLHNRITRRIDLEPFNLHETEQYLRSRNVNLDRYQVLQIYMALGGIPHYLKEVRPGLSAAENIDKICFSKSGLLTDEFLKLYPALFDNAENHLAVIRTLATKWKGLSRKEIIDLSGLPDGGNTTRVLEELAHSGFISLYFPFGKKKREVLYRLTDEYSLFYLHFIESRSQQGEGIWKSLALTPTVKSWSGYAFESICLKHLSQIKKALGISGVYAEASSFSFRGNDQDPGIQIDLLLDRNDRIINLFEIKFYNSIWALTKTEAAQLRERVAIFKRATETPKHVFLTLLTTFGVRPNEHSIGLVDRSFDLEILFASSDT